MSWSDRNEPIAKSLYQAATANRTMSLACGHGPKQPMTSWAIYHQRANGITGIGRVCRIFGRGIYRALGADNIRRRRKHAPLLPDKDHRALKEFGNLPADLTHSEGLMRSKRVALSSCARAICSAVIRGRTTSLASAAFLCPCSA